MVEGSKYPGRGEIYSRQGLAMKGWWQLIQREYLLVRRVSKVHEVQQVWVQARGAHLASSHQRARGLAIRHAEHFPTSPMGVCHGYLVCRSFSHCGNSCTGWPYCMPGIFLLYRWVYGLTKFKDLPSPCGKMYDSTSVIMWGSNRLGKMYHGAVGAQILISDQP